jgi:uncharacterized membrane-anchored protein
LAEPYDPGENHDVYAAIGVEGANVLEVNFGTDTFRWEGGNEMAWRNNWTSSDSKALDKKGASEIISKSLGSVGKMISGVEVLELARPRWKKVCFGFFR